MDFIINMSAVAAHYRKLNKHEKFCVKERSFSDAAAAGFDLEAAERMVTSLEEPMNNRGEDPSEFFKMSALAILGMGIIQYARATKPRSQSRGAVDIEDLLPAELLDDHKHIHNLRNDAIAHLGAGKRPGTRAWFQGITHLRVHGEMGWVRFQSTRSFFEQEAFDQLKRLIPAARGIVDEIARARSDELGKLTSELWATNPSFDEQCRKMLLTDKDLIEGGYSLSELLSYPAGEQIHSSRDFERIFREDRSG